MTVGCFFKDDDGLKSKHSIEVPRMHLTYTICSVYYYA